MLRILVIICAWFCTGTAQSNLRSSTDLLMVSGMRELAEDLSNLLKLGVQIESITCDGHRSLLKAI